MKKRQHPGETLAQPNESSIHTVRWILSAAAVLVVLAHLYAAFFPSGMNWGFHQLGFFSPIGKVGVPFLMLLFIIPPIQLTILRVIFRMTELLSRYKRSVKVALIFFLLVGSAFAFWVGRERVFFLGDGNMIVRTMPKVNNLDDIPRVFPNEPLAGFILWKGYQLCQSWNLLPSEEFPIQVVNAAFGVGCVFLFVLLVRQISSGVIDQVLVFAFIIAAGGTQLLFGYVEDYPPLYFGLILYLWLALSSLQGNTHPALPSMAFGFMFALHFGMVVMVPSLVLLWYDQVRKKQWSVVVKSCIATVLTVILLLGLSGYTVDLFFSVFLKSRSHLLAASHTTSDDQAYTFFSLAHLNDLVNLQLLLAPFALFTLILMVILQRKVISYRSIPWIFLLFIDVGGLGFSIMFNFGLGMSRDWDLLASFNLGLTITAAYALIYFSNEQSVVFRTLVMMIGITLLHTASCVLVNADEDRSVARFTMLPERQLWGRRPLLAGYEELAIFYRGKKDPLRAIEYYKKFLSIDSTNSRIWCNIAYIYHLTGDQEHEMQYDQKAIQLGTTYWDIYLDLGIIYLERKRYEEAAGMFQKAMELNPISPDPPYHFGAATIKGKGGDREAIPFFLQALKLDSTYADAYLAAGMCYNHLGMVSDMKYYLSKYLDLNPSTPSAATIRWLLNIPTK